MVINYKTQDFEAEIKDAGVDLIIDFVGKDYYAKNVSILRRDGTVVYLAFLSGAVVEKANIGVLLAKRLTIKGSTLRSRTVEYQANLLQKFKEEALPLIRDGKMSIEVHEVSLVVGWGARGRHCLPHRHLGAASSARWPGRGHIGSLVTLQP